MASSTKDRCGFRQKHIGRAINEGYTELLTYRYFLFDNASSVGYDCLKIIVENLEKIVGKEKMKSLYLNANLYGLIEKLKNYSTEEEIMKFIANTDFVLSNLKYRKVNLLEKKLLTKSLKEINKFLVISFCNVLMEVFDDNILTKEECEVLLDDFINSVIIELNLKKHKLEINTPEEINEWIKESMYNKILNENKVKKLSKNY